MRALAVAVALALSGCGRPAPASPPPPQPDEPEAERASTPWPFVAWDRAEAFHYNQLDYGPGIPLLVYGPGSGWSPHIADRAPMTADQAERAVAYTIETRGEIVTSSCPFPRHAVVLYAGDAPVASVNVCFTCDDVLVWPEYEPELDWERYDDYSEAELAAFEKQQEAKETALETVLPKWRALFGDELGWSVEPWPNPS